MSRASRAADSLRHCDARRYHRHQPIAWPMTAPDNTRKGDRPGPSPVYAIQAFVMLKWQGNLLHMHPREHRRCARLA